MSKYAAAIIVFALICLAGGTFAYVEKHEIASIISSGGLAVLLIGCAALTKTNPRAGFIGASVLVLLNLGWWLSQLISKGPVFFPIVFYIVLSLALLAFLLGGHFFQRRLNAQNGATKS